MDKSQLSFGERAVGLSFNPAQNKDVEVIKSQCAKLIDDLNDLRNVSGDGDVKRMLSTAITELQTAQMWAVKAVTWNL